ncbi:hypothetical protein HPB49_008934 [Dermacentor silvarum]|uniref:Uncharacterized protein n=1 Tax=Dermacentor silvarum TaxID=543639 RepID=A0ACB8DXN0_DERSI|nr:hypothetical protein HPB49_008934 [Dermacentor silvarum]
MMKDGYNSANRYYVNRFKDAYRQATIDLMLGNPITEDFMAVSPEQDDEPVLEMQDQEHQEHVKQLIEHCKKMLIPESEVVLGGWALIDADPVTGDPGQADMDSILVLTKDSYYVAEYDDQTDRITKYQRVFLEDLEKMELESLKAICESFKVALSVKSLSVPLFEGKLERRRSKLPFVQGERPGSLGLAPLGAMTRNMSEGQLMAFVSVGSRALSNVTSQFARLNPMRSVRGLAKRPAAALGALTEGSFQVDSSSDSEEDSARWLRQPLPATERTLSSDYSSDSDAPEPGHDALLESCGILATSPGLANCEQRPPAHQAVDIDDFVLDAMRRASLRQPKTQSAALAPQIQVLL